VKSEDKFGSGALILDILGILVIYPFNLILINLILIIFITRRGKFVVDRAKPRDT